MSKRPQAGFTLVEIMIVVAIIGILAAVAVPAYQNYTVRSQVTEGFTLAAGWKDLVIEYYGTNGTWPSQTDLLDTAPSIGKYETQVTVNNGVIQIKYGGVQANPNIQDAVLTLVPYTNDNDEVLWRCGSAAPPSGKMASGAEPVPTTVAPQYLPTSCHS